MNILEIYVEIVIQMMKLLYLIEHNLIQIEMLRWQNSIVVREVD